MTTTLVDAVIEAQAELGFGEGPEAIFNSPEWSAKRREYQEYKDAYDGAEWRTTTGERDKHSGEPVLRFPLQVNPIAKACRIHRAILFGVRTESADLPVRTVALADNAPVAREAQLHFQNFVNDVWRRSDGIATLEEAGLLVQIYGGHFFKVAWEFWNDNLPHRIAVRSLKSPAWCLPVWDAYDEWNLVEAYIGYYITREMAQLKYGIQVEGRRALYLEHWTRDTYRITVNGKVPIMRWRDTEYALEGEHGWGIVPIVYIPHERDGDFYGRSLVADLPGLARELNARLADKGDAVRETAHRLLFVRNTRTKGPIKGRPIIVDGRRIAEAVDIGDAPPLQGAREPDMNAIESRGVPESLSRFTAELWDEIRRQADIAPVAMGADDVSGGRITGPVTAYRMFPSIAHTMTERANFSVGLNHVARAIGRIAVRQTQRGVYAALGLPDPGITEDMLGLELKQAWLPMIPFDRIQRVQELTLRLQAGGISLETYLRELGEDDVPQEIERIWADYERELSIQAALGQKLKRRGAQSAGGN